MRADEKLTAFVELERAIYEFAGPLPPSLAWLRGGCGNHRGITREKEILRRFHELPHGLKELLQVAMTHSHPIARGCDHAGMAFDKSGVVTPAA